MKYFRYLLLALVAICLVTFALANRALAPVQLLPDSFANLFGLDISIQVPVWVILFAGLLVGLVLGFVWEWLRGHSHRAAARGARREVTRLEREMAVMKDSSSVPKDEILALIDKPKAR
jgi:lipopolysaccharide assembly protein A